jgi:hypothetical protein
MLQVPQKGMLEPENVRTHETVQNHGKKIASPENVDLLGKNFTCGSEYSNYLSNIRIREKRLSDPQEMNCWAQKVAGSEEENAGSGNVGPLKRTDARI